MSYDIEFAPGALKAWRKLDPTLRSRFARKLEERRQQPRVEADRMRGGRDRFRLKQRSAGVRLVYQVRDERLIILVLSVGSRANDEVYDDAERELKRLE